MVLTPEKAREMLNMLLLMAKQKRSEIPYSKSDDFPQSVLFLGPNLEPVVTPIHWATEGEKYAKLKIISKTAEKMMCQGVALISDTRWVEEEKAVKMLGIPPMEEVGLEAFQKNYKRVVTERFGGYLGNAPKELFTESILVAMKGPTLGGIISRLAPYDEGPNDSIHWLKPPNDHKTHHFNLLPDWWN